MEASANMSLGPCWRGVLREMPQLVFVVVDHIL